MKTLPPLARFLPRARPKEIRAKPKPAATGPSTPPPLPRPKPAEGAEDGPPGYKLRWTH